MLHQACRFVWLFAIAAAMPGCATSAPTTGGAAEDPHIHEACMLSEAERADSPQLLTGVPNAEQRFQQDLAVWVKAHKAMMRSVKFEGNRLVNVIDYCIKTTGMPIDVRWSALEEVGVERDSPVTLTIQENESLAAALGRVLAQAGAIAQFDPIGLGVAEERLMVTTVRELRRLTYVRMYPIQDLISTEPTAFDLLQDRGLAEEAKRFYRMLRQDFKTLSRQDQAPAVSIFGEGDFDAEASSEERVQQIVNMLQDTVGIPEEWVNLYSSMREFDGVLIIKTNFSNHLEVEQSLAALREARVRGQLRQLRTTTATVMLLEAELRRFADPPDLDGAWAMVEKALEIAPTDPLVRFYAEQLTGDLQAKRKREGQK